MLLALPACAPADSDAPTEVTLQGWVAESPWAESTEQVMSAEEATLTISSLEALFEDIEGHQPYEDYPGYWQAKKVPVGQEYQLRLHGGEGWRDTLWRGEAPPGDGIWTSLFAANKAEVDEVLRDAGDLAGVDPNLDAGVTLWGAVAEGASLDLHQLGVEVAGNEARVDGFTVDEGGQLLPATEDIEWFFAFNLPRGTIFLDVAGESGQLTHAWNAEPGDLISAWNLVPPE